MIARLEPSCSFVCSDSTVSSTGVSGSSPANRRRQAPLMTRAARYEQLGDTKSMGIYRQESSAAVDRCASERWRCNPEPVSTEKLADPI